VKIDFDFSEVMALSARLESTPDKIAPKVMSAIKFTSGEVKKDARNLTSGMYRLHRVPSTIDYDIITSADGVESEIGFNKRGQGNMGHWIEYGSRHFGARGPLTQALYQNREDFIRGLTKAAVSVMDVVL